MQTLMISVEPLGQVSNNNNHYIDVKYNLTPSKHVKLGVKHMSTEITDIWREMGYQID